MGPTPTPLRRPMHLQQVTTYNSVDNNNFPLRIQVAPEAFVRYTIIVRKIIGRAAIGGGQNPLPPLPTPLGTLQKSKFKLLHSSMQTSAHSADHRSRRRHVAYYAC